MLCWHFRQPPIGWLKFERGTFWPLVMGVKWNVEGRGWDKSIAHPWVPISSRVTHMVYLLPFLSYLAGSKSSSAHPSGSDTMTNTTLKALTSSSSKIGYSPRSLFSQQSFAWKHSWHLDCCCWRIVLKSCQSWIKVSTSNSDSLRNAILVYRAMLWQRWVGSHTWLQ